MNHKKERFKVFKVESRSNRDDVIIKLLIILNINKFIKLLQIEYFIKIVQMNIEMQHFQV